MAVKTNITINIVEPGSDVPVPDTGLFTHGIGNAETTIIVSAALVTVLVILSIVLTTYMYRKHKKQGRTTKLVHIIDQTKAVVKSKKRVTIGLTALALLASVGTLTALLSSTNKNNTNAKEGEEGLTINAESKELTIEVKDQPVFAVLPVQVTVEEATQAGYTLTAYTDNTDLVSTTNPNNKIPMVTVEGDELTSLQDNTWGLALDNEPTAKDNKVYTALSTDQTNPTLITDKDYEETPANDTTTIYYGFYITPDIPYGTYTGGEVEYEAVPNLATITYNASGLYYNDDESSTSNIVGYKPSTSGSTIEEITGEYITPTPLSSSSSPIHYNFLGWSKTEGASVPDYVDKEDIMAHLTLTPNESLTLYAVWHYNTVLSFNGNTSDGGTSILERTIPAGDAIALPENTYTRTHSVFTGWNTVENPTPENPGRSYDDGADFTASEGSADIILYAQWAYTTNITFDGNTSDSGSTNTQTIVAGVPENLTPNAFTKTNATFIGWNTEEHPTTDNPGTSYADEQEYVADTEHPADITLYAQWAYTIIAFDGNTSDSGSMNPITIAGDTAVTLPQNTFTKAHCSFNSWNTAADGSGTRIPGETQYEASNTGIYSFTLYAQWQCESIINFYGNGATSGEMNSIMATGGQPTTLPQNAYTRDGYEFNGWNTKADGAGISYEDQSTYTAPVSQSITLELYAQWKQVFYMQDVATWGSMLSEGSSMEAIDRRDGKTYWVAKLKDGNIWMTQNLDFDIVNGGAGLDYTNTDVPENWADAGNLTNTHTTGDTTWNWSYTTSDSYDPGNLYWDGTITTTTSDSAISRRTVANPSKTSGGTHYHIGNYYNWTAAVAMNDSGPVINGQDVDQSICPAGWRLPTNRGNKSYENLAGAQSLTTGVSGNIHLAPSYFVYSGRWEGSSFMVGYLGVYWSGVYAFPAFNRRSSYSLQFNAYSGSINTSSTVEDQGGWSVRCVMR